MNRAPYPRLLPIRRPATGVGEWLAAMVRGFDALDFLERSRDLASETVAAAPATHLEKRSNQTGARR